MAAPWAYFDTSVLLKRYVRERGSRRARSLLRRYRFLSSALSPLEAMSALYRRHATGELAPQDLIAIVTRIHRDRDHWEFIEVSPQVLTRAEEVIQQTGVRMLDAVHVASAMTFQLASGLRIPFITADARQQHAAGQLALELIWAG